MMPVLISRIARSAAVASFCSTMRAICAARVAHDAAVAVRVVELDGEHAPAPSPRGVDQPLQRVRRGSAARRRRAPGSAARRRDAAAPACTRVAGAELRLLLRPDADRGCGERPRAPLAAMAVDHADALRLQSCARRRDMREQRLAGQRMQHLGQVRMHALALAGGEDDDVHADALHGGSHGAKMLARTTAWEACGRRWQYGDKSATRREEWRGRVDVTQLVIGCAAEYVYTRMRIRRFCHLRSPPLPRALVWSCSAAAEIYKWVDEKGVTNYGSPPGQGQGEGPRPAIGTGERLHSTAAGVAAAGMPCDARPGSTVWRTKCRRSAAHARPSRLRSRAKKTSVGSLTSNAFATGALTATKSATDHAPVLRRRLRAIVRLWGFAQAGIPETPHRAPAAFLRHLARVCSRAPCLPRRHPYFVSRRPRHAGQSREPSRRGR